MHHPVTTLGPTPRVSPPHPRVRVRRVTAPLAAAAAAPRLHTQYTGEAFFEPVQEQSSIVKTIIDHNKNSSWACQGWQGQSLSRRGLASPGMAWVPDEFFFEPVQKQTLPWASWSIKGIPLPNCSTKGFPSMAVLPAQLPAQPGPPEPLTSFFRPVQKTIIDHKKTGPGPMGQGMPGHGF